MARYFSWFIFLCMKLCSKPNSSCIFSMSDRIPEVKFTMKALKFGAVGDFRDISIWNLMFLMRKPGNLSQHVNLLILSLYKCVSDSPHAVIKQYLISLREYINGLMLTEWLSKWDSNKWCFHFHLSFLWTNSPFFLANVGVTSWLLQIDFLINLILEAVL